MKVLLKALRTRFRDPRKHSGQAAVRGRRSPFWTLKRHKEERASPLRALNELERCGGRQRERRWYTPTRDNARSRQDRSQSKVQEIHRPLLPFLPSRPLWRPSLSKYNQRRGARGLHRQGSPRGRQSSTGKDEELQEVKWRRTKNKI